MTVFSIGNTVLGSAMVVCFILTVNRAIAVFEADWFTGLLSMQREIIIGAFLVALEVQITRRVFDPDPVLSREWWQRILPEWAFWLVALLLLIWSKHGPALTLSDLPQLGEKTAQVLRRPEFVEGLLLLIAVWGISRFLTNDLMAVENIPTATTREAMRGVIQEQIGIRNRLWQDVFILGGAMVFLAVFSVPLAHFLFGMPMAFGSLGVETLIYFLCGFGLFVIGRLLILKAEWVTERTGVDSSVTRHWMIYGLLFVVLLLLLSVALPTAYTFQLLASLNLVLMGLSMLMSILWMAVVYPVIWLLSHIFPAIGGPTEEMQETPPDQGVGQALPSLPQGVTWEMIAREILFWAIVILILVYIARQVLPMRFAVLRRLRHTFLFRRLLEFWLRLRKRWTVWSRSAAQTLRESWDALRADLGGRGVSGRGGFLNLRGLDPRQSVRFYFFALLRRGAEGGVVRRPAQTPREYSGALSDAEERIRVELEEITLAFEEARYSAHPVSPEKARQVRKVWDTIRTALRSSRQKDE
ncbi:MAG: DUF4129 domain-containing protein [Anaerolineales bacterium]|nr:DUF4129 domain-containing protein [Anaerolineales bacterium]